MRHGCHAGNSDAGQPDRLPIAGNHWHPGAFLTRNLGVDQNVRNQTVTGHSDHFDSVASPNLTECKAASAHGLHIDGGLMWRHQWVGSRLPDHATAGLDADF